MYPVSAKVHANAATSKTPSLPNHP